MTARRVTSLAGVGITAAALLRIAIALRFGEPPAEWTGDARVYLRIAEALRAGSLPPEGWIWPPGYPLLGALLASVVGAGTGLRVASLLGGTLASVVLLLAGRATGRAVAGAVAALVVAFLPESALASVRPLSDAVALALVPGTVLLAEVAFHRNRVWLAALAGGAAALSALTRPETTLAALGLIVLALARRRRPRSVLAFVAVLVIGVSPYVAGLKAESGVWGLSLKPRYNLLKAAVYQGPGTYEDQRKAWGEVLDRFRDAEGHLDPRRIAGAVNLGQFVFSKNVAIAWLGHVAQGARSIRPDFALLLVLGAVGLALRDRRSDSTRLPAVVAALPFLAVPVFLNPVGRFLLPLVPPLAWGVGRLVEWNTGRGGPARRRWSGTVILALALLGAGGGGSAAWKEAIRERWARASVRIDAALEAGDPGRAEAILRPFLRGGVSRAIAQTTLGGIRESSGDLDGAEAAYRNARSAGGSSIPLADLLARRGRYEEAERLFGELRPEPPHLLAYWLLAGHLASARGRWCDAAEAFTRTVELPGAPPEAEFNRGLALVRCGRTEEGVAVLEGLVRDSSPPVAERARRLLEYLRTADGAAE